MPQVTQQILRPGLESRFNHGPSAGRLSTQPVVPQPLPAWSSSQNLSPRHAAGGAAPPHRHHCLALAGSPGVPVTGEEWRTDSEPSSPRPQHSRQQTPRLPRRHPCAQDPVLGTRPTRGPTSRETQALPRPSPHSVPGRRQSQKLLFLEVVTIPQILHAT